MVYPYMYISFCWQGGSCISTVLPYFCYQQYHKIWTSDFYSLKHQKQWKFRVLLSLANVFVEFVAKSDIVIWPTHPKLCVCFTFSTKTPSRGKWADQFEKLDENGTGIQRHHFLGIESLGKSLDVMSRSSYYNWFTSLYIYVDFGGFIFREYKPLQHYNHSRNLQTTPSSIESPSINSTQMLQPKKTKRIFRSLKKIRPFVRCIDSFMVGFSSYS